MTSRCPFIDLLVGDKAECVYLCAKTETCDELGINQGNGDAWCRNMVEVGLGYLSTVRKGLKE